MNCYRERHDKWICRRCFVASCETVTVGNASAAQTKGRERNDRAAHLHVARRPGPRWAARPLPLVGGGCFTIVPIANQLPLPFISEAKLTPPPPLPPQTLPSMDVVRLTQCEMLCKLLRYERPVEKQQEGNHLSAIMFEIRPVATLCCLILMFIWRINCKCKTKCPDGTLSCLLQVGPNRELAASHFSKDTDWPPSLLNQQ